jgi:hypothetical protein
MAAGDRRVQTRRFTAPPASLVTPDCQAGFFRATHLVGHLNPAARNGPAGFAAAPAIAVIVIRRPSLQIWDSCRRLPATPARLPPACLSMIPGLTKGQLTILRLIDAFDGRLSAADIVGFVRAVAQLPESEFMPIERPLAKLKQLGLVKSDRGEDSRVRYRVTAQGAEIAAE